MAQVPNDETQTVSPDVRTPDDFQHIDAQPGAFGAQVGQGLDAVGAGAAKATQFYGQVAADDGTNQYVSGVNKLLYGDPSHMVQQPDGTMAPDTGYFGLKGADQMRAYPNVVEQLESMRKDVRENLTTPESQLQFDEYSRRFAQMKQSEIGERYERSQNEWAVNTNKDGAQLALSSIARTAGDDKAFASSLEDLKAHYVRAAQVQGLGPAGTKLALENAQRDAWTTRIETTSVNDPAGAQAMVEAHKAELGTEYERLANSVRARADQAAGKAFATTEIAKEKTSPGALAATNNLNPKTGEVLTGATTNRDGSPAPAVGSGPTPAADAAQGNKTIAAREGKVYSPDDLYRAFHGQESSGGANTTTSIDNAHGDMQITPGTFNAYAKPGERIDNPADNIAVGKRILADYSQRYGGDPARVAVAYFSGPGNVAPPGSPTPWKENRHDGQGTYVSQYVNGIMGKLGAPGITGITPPPLGHGSLVASGTIAQPGWQYLEAEAKGAADASTTASTAAPTDLPPPPAAPAPVAPQAPSPEETKAAIFQAIEKSSLSDGAKEAARRHATEQLATEEIIANQTAKAKKDASDKAADGYVTNMLAGHAQPNIIQQIANDPHLEWQTKLHLFDAAKAHSGSDVEESKAAYGPGFWDLYKRAAAPAGTPGKLSDPDEILSHAGPNGDLTLAGVQKIRATMLESQKSVGDASVAQAKAGLLNYARSKMTFDQEMLYPGVPPLKDQKGVQIFEGQFIPKFEAAYDQWMKAGKNPWDFLKQDNVDELMKGMRDPRKMAQDKIAAGQNATGEAIGAEPGAQAFPVPEGVKPQDWSTMLQNPPTHADGSRINPAAWAKTLELFGSNPNEEMVKQFDESQARRSAAGQPVLSVTGQEILLGLQGKLRPSRSTPAVENSNAMPIYTGP